MTYNSDAKAWLCRATGISSNYLRTVPMQGATSSSLFLVRDGREERRRFVLRLFDRHEWLAQEPDLVVHEVAALQEAGETGVLAPEVVAYSTEDAGFGAPVVLMSYVEGRVEIRPSDTRAWLVGLAEPLAQLHGHGAKDFGWRYRSWVNRALLEVPSWTRKPDAWEEAIELWWRGAPATREVFIHRDYHPVNVLWQGGRVSGVVDWGNACLGPAHSDVAHCRCNLVMMFEPESADRFLEAYLERAGGEYEPFWDVDAVLDMALPQPQFYAPWQEFGLSIISNEVLQRRVDDYLESAVKRTG